MEKTYVPFCKVNETDCPPCPGKFDDGLLVSCADGFTLLRN